MIVSKALSLVLVPDYAVMRRVNRWHAPRCIRWWTVVASRAGDGWLWGTCGILLLFSRDGTRYAALTAAALAIATGILLFKTLKRAIGRKRPCFIEPHCWARLQPPDQFSFPSGHSITAFSTAVSLGLFYPSIFSELLFCAVSVSASRVLLGMHFLSDVLVGSAFGVVLGYFAFTLVK